MFSRNIYWRCILTLIFTSVLALSFAVASPAVTAPNLPPTTTDKIILNFENADIQSVIKAISKLSGKNFVIDPRVKGTVNIVSEQPINKSDSYKVLETALRMQGFATVEADGVIKVLPEVDARTYGMRTEGKLPQPKSQGDQLVTKVYIIENGSASQLANALRTIVSPNNTISVYTSSNALLVTDYASNITRISQIVHDLQLSKGNRIMPVTINLIHATAADVAQTLQSFNSGGSAATGGGSGGSSDFGPPAQITVDATTNSIIIAATLASKIEDLKKLALDIDKIAATTNSNMHVVYLKNADALHVAEVLRVLATGQDNPDLTATPASRALSDTSSMFSSSDGGGSNQAFGGSSSGGSQSRQPSPSRSIGGGSALGGNDKNAPKVIIQAEPTTNSLIIQAPEAIYRNLRMVVNLLDVRRVQVMVEALIADIDTSQQGTFGIQWIGGVGNNSLGLGVISNYAGDSNSASSLITSGMAIANAGKSGTSGATGGTTPSIPGEVYVGLVTGTTTIGGQPVPTISTLADMLAANSANNILGRPTILTLDNEEASFFVGSNVGLPTGSFQNSGASPGSISTSVGRKDVGTLLRIKPLVTQNGAIQLTVNEEDSSLDKVGLSAPELIQLGPNFKKRSLKTQILVDDGQIIALGGMTADQVEMTTSGIPILSSIPYLGWLFSWQSRKLQKANMVIFLRPIIIRNQEGYQALSNQRYNYVVGQQNMIKASGNLLLPRIDAVTLDNQVPYSNHVPPQQESNLAVEPIVDLRSSATPLKN